MVDDADLGWFANWLGLVVVILVVFYHLVVAEANTAAPQSLKVTAPFHSSVTLF
mgnify:CR=1 FL=1